jgi:hypothetical protein
MKKLTMTGLTLLALFGLGGCMTMQELDSCIVNEQGAVIEEGQSCPSSRDRLPQRRQGPGTW